MSKDITIKEKYPPGDFAVWIIIYVELVTFGLFFLGYIISRRDDIKLFNGSQEILSQTSGFINTFILISSSYFVVKAVGIIQSMTQENYKELNLKASNWLILALSCAVIFLIIKITEFSHIFGLGINLSTNKFFMFYILLTGFHFMHVLLGSVILFNICQKAKKHGYSPDNYLGFESGASYWHMVDLLWIVLFPLIYIIK